jgi:hypothetical protein
MRDATERLDARTDGRRNEDTLETRSQQGGVGGTTRFGMEDGYSPAAPTKGGPALDEPEWEQSS